MRVNLHYRYGWRRWFAWRPVMTPGGIIIWFETVERRRCYTSYGLVWSWWEFRAL